MARPVHIQWTPGDLSLAPQRPGPEADPSRQSSTEIRSEWSYISTPCMPCCYEQGQMLPLHMMSTVGKGPYHLYVYVKRDLQCGVTLVALEGAYLT